MLNYFAWCCDYKTETGEGQLARKYLNKYFYDKKVKVRFPKKEFLFKDYFYQYFGIIILWINYFKGNRVIYVNYLPLWNFPIFLLCPPKTIFGPITGSIQINKIRGFKSFLRLIIFPLFYKISLIFLNLRCKKIIFSTNILKNSISNKILKKSLLNFILLDFKSYKSKLKKRYDLIVYFRKHENKFYDHHYMH